MVPASGGRAAPGAAGAGPDAAPGDRAAGVPRRAVSDRLAGTLVHRLMERYGGESPGEAAVLAELADLVPGDELPEAEADRADLVQRAVAAHRDLAAKPEVARLLASGEVHHEVPFSVRLDGQLRRGVLDCLVRSTDGHVTILEFKTGRERPEHRAQLEAYRAAAARLFPGSPVDGKLFYASHLGRIMK